MRILLIITTMLYWITVNCQNSNSERILERTLKSTIFNELLTYDYPIYYIDCKVNYSEITYQKELGSEGFDKDISFLLIKLFHEIPKRCYDSANTNIRVVEIVNNPISLIIAYNKKNKRIYRISGFKNSDFLELIFDNNLLYPLSKYKSKKRFLKYLFIENIDMALLYEKNIGIYGKRGRLKKIKTLFYEGRTNDNKLDFYKK